MADDRLLSYIKSSLERGVPPAEIKSELYDAGWSKKDIEEAIASLDIKPEIQRASAAGQPETGTKHRRKIYMGVIALLAAVGIVTYFAVLLLISPASQIQQKCGDGICSFGESYEICPEDCQAPIQNKTLKLSVSPPSAVANKGGNVEIGIEIYSDSDVYGFQFDLIYDPSSLGYSKSAEGIFLNNNKTDNTFCVPVQPSISADKAHVTFACTRLGPVGGVSGNGVLESVIFNAISSGKSELKLANLKLVDADVNEMVAESENGSVTVQG